MKRMLVGVDGSPAAATALSWGVRVAKALDADLIVANVYSAEPVEPISWDAAHELARERLDLWCAGARAAGVDVDAVVVDGEVGPALLATAMDHDVDLLVLSRRGVGGFGGLLLGSAADYVAHHTHLPLAVLPPHLHTIVPEHVLLALDGSPGAVAATRWCADVAAALGARVTAMYVLPVPELGVRPTGKQREQAESWLHDWTEPLRRAGIAVEHRVSADRHVADALIAMAETEGADTIVVGTRSVGGLRWIRLGGVTMQLLHHGDRPVVVVPPLD